MKLSLPTVTLLCVDCVNAERAIASVDRCKSVCDFGAVKFLTSLPTDYPHVVIDPLQTLVHYSIWMLKKCHEYIDTKHFLVCQHDAWIINPEAWEDHWLGYDYIAPLFTQYDIMGSGGFSLRTKALMKVVSEQYGPWDGTLEDANRVQDIVGSYEDGAISIGLYNLLTSLGFKYAPIPEANKFAQGGNPATKHRVEKPFGFHREGRIGLRGPLVWPDANPI
jgi:hypothetical protein